MIKSKEARDFKIGQWVKLESSHQKGCIHNITHDRKYVILVPREDWPFPTWVTSWGDNLRAINKPRYIEDVVEYELEPAPF